jgi:hypothetical protein
MSAPLRDLGHTSPGATPDALSRLRRLVELQRKTEAAIIAEEDFLVGTIGVSFKATARIRGVAEWWVAREYRKRHEPPQEQPG